MRVRALLTISLALGAMSVSCSQISTSGTTQQQPDPFCLPETGCTTNPDPNANIDPYNIPGRTGTQTVGGTSMTPFDPMSPGSTGVTMGPGGAIGLDLNGFKNAGAPYIWVANSGEGTESKINVNTNVEVGRYCTYPGCNGDPSRSTVSLQGDAVIANRASYYGINAPERASAVKIAGDKSRCVDRNGNGQIDTNEAAGPVPAQFFWPAGQKDSPDECVLWLTDLSRNAAGAIANTLPRAASFDSTIAPDGSLSTYVYIGLFNTSEILRLDAKTGAIVKRIPVPGNNPYGLVTDKDGNVWVRGGNLTKIDVKNNDTVSSYPESSGCGYGITADSRGYIYTASSACIARFNPAQPAMGWEQVNVPGGACFMRGLALDSKFNLWAADTCMGIYHFDATANYRVAPGMVYKRLVSPRGTGNDKYYLGIGMDVNENAWVVSEGTGNLGVRGGTGMVYHINPTDYTFVGVQTGQNPYTYSDMTGVQLRIAGTPFGIYRHTFKSDCAPLKTTWTEVTYDLDTPAGTTIEISSRGAGSQQALDSALFGPATVIPPAQPGAIVPAIAEGVDNAFLQLQFKMTTNAQDKTPLVRNLSAKYICG
jgi:hypothetical protein